MILGLDFDGTLAPLASRPSLARLPERTRRLLLELSGKPGVRLAVVSGRSLRDIQRLVALPGVYHAGNHGLEIEGPGLSWRHPQVKKLPPIVGGIARGLKNDLRGFPGILLEDKGLSLSVHYRRADPRVVPAVKKILNKIVRPQAGSLKIFSAKMTWELRPVVDWDKGHALMKIAELHGPGNLIVFVGDDKSDEQAFRTLGPGAVTIRVGGARGRARYRLKDTREVQTFLKLLLEDILPCTK